MIKRYKVGAYLPRTYFLPHVPGSSTSLTSTYHEYVTGAPGAVVSFKVTAYSASPGSPVFTVGGVTHLLNDTFTKTLDGTGNVTFDIVIGFLSGGSGQGINVTLAITGASAGKLGSPLTLAEEKTT